jgi:uncharacterized heparinase superfamily protein
MLGDDRFRMLEEEHRIVAAADWSRAAWPALWLYHLHYHDDLVAEGAPERRDWHRSLLDRWIADNPPGRSPGWDPYPTSRRICNWVRWSLDGGTLDPAAIASLAVQARWLERRLEYHLLANHLFVNAKALIVAGTFFQGPEAERWRSLGHRILARELDEQVLADGGHVERSPMYHAALLLDLLELIALGSATGEPPPATWRAHAGRMLAWLGTMTHPDGEIGLFNDAAFDGAPRCSALSSYASALGVPASTVPPRPVTFLHQTGYARLEARGAVLICDMAPIGPDYQPGHAHADTLGFELSLHGRRLIVDSGTSRYGIGPERQRQRSTGAHNTIMVDGADSSEIWAGFRVARRARVVGARAESTPDAATAEAAHDGYRRLRGVGEHRRRWELRDGSLTIHDHLAGRGQHQVSTALHLHPDVSAHLDRDVAVLDLGGGRTAEVRLDPRLTWAVEPTTWHPRFGVSIPSVRLVGRTSGALPLEFRTILAW